MATDFPAGLDNLISPSPADVLDSADPKLLHTNQHGNANDAINAIQQKLGIDFSDVQNSIDYISRLVLLITNQHQGATYREIDGFPFPQSISWYQDNTKVVILTQKEFIYTTSVVPAQVVFRLFDGTPLNNVVRTITDTISYNGIFETHRTRTIL